VAVIFLDEGVIVRCFQPYDDAPPRREEPRRGDYVTSPDEPLVQYPDERWASYVVYPQRTDIW